MNNLTRRQFVITSAAGTLGVACSTAVVPIREKSWPQASPVSFIEESANSFPILQVSGTPFEVGRAVGDRFGGLIRQGLDRRQEWFEDLLAFARGAGADALSSFAAAAKKFTPRAFEELMGMADGSGLPNEALMVLNHKAELTALKRIVTHAAEISPSEEEVPGCSSAIFATDGRVIHAHNEDGLDAYIGLMFHLRVRPEVGEPYESLCYPGILPGNGPSQNGYGLIQTTNFINSRTVKIGVGRYFLDRMVLEASSIDEAIGISTHPERAYAYHHVLTSIPKGRSVAIEVAPETFQTNEINGLYVHTNHFVLDDMKGLPQYEPYVESSSISRYRVLEQWKNENESKAQIAAEDLLGAMSSHEGQPISPCRHPHGDIHGTTLGTSVWDTTSAAMRQYKTQSCNRSYTDYPLVDPYSKR